MKILKNDKELKNTTFLFPAGEVGATVDVANLKYLFEDAPYQTIVARIQRSNDVMQLALLKDALERFDDTPIRLVLPYLPYSRQDRVCCDGESFSLKVFADVINSLRFDKVTIFDPHSDVAGAVLNNVKIIKQKEIIGKFDALNARLLSSKPEDCPVFISPDAGANKKTADLAAYFGHPYFVRADKTRELSTGKLTGFKVYAGCDEAGHNQIEGRDVVICDDIADGSGTFIGLAKELKANGARNVILYVTHGIFSKGVDILFDGGISEVYCTNSYRDDDIDSRVKMLKLEEVFNL